MALHFKLWLWRSPASEESIHSGRFRALTVAAASRESSPQAFPETNLPCDACDGRGWTICAFCSGQKTNVQVRKSRFYRRCPSCKAVGSVLCSRCRVFRCITFPDESDGSLHVATAISAWQSLKVSRGFQAQSIEEKARSSGFVAAMASLKAVSVTHVRYEVGDDIGHLMAWASLLPILISAGFVSHFIFRRELLAIFFAAGLVMSEFCNEKIKQEVKQARPLTCEVLEMCDSHGWPSSHSQYMAFFSIFLSLSALFRWSFPGELRRAMAVILPWPFAAATMYSRIYLGYHTGSQVMAGAVAGVLMGSLWYFVVYRLMVPLFPVIEESWIARALYIKDSGHIPNVLKFEYENSRRARRGGAAADGGSKRNVLRSKDSRD